MRICRGERGLQERVGLNAGLGKVARRKPDIAQTQLSGHSPEPMQEKFGGYPWIANPLKIFNSAVVVSAMKFSVSGRYRGDRFGLFSWIFCLRTHDEIAESASTVEIEDQRAEPGLAKIE